ncbi:MAG: Na/Pi cotransporter family protein [Candidatus ainarchaeum sp.]|nr:Na/Pi cotransporter family protein [Candidatus ainarchaeum sp.]
MISELDVIFAIFPGVILFLYGIQHFSEEIQKVAGEKFRKILEKFTRNPIKGTIFGAIVTAIVQSSHATTLITLGLVNAGIISFYNSIGIIFGANIGTTITAQLIAFKLTGFAPVIMIFGFLLGLLGGKKYKFLGKPIFYFGLVFFSLNMISAVVFPLKDDPEILSLFSTLSNFWIAILVGFILTNIFQSSSVSVGLTVVFVQAGLVTLDQAVPVLLGANLGTTTTILVASLSMDLFSKRVAATQFLFNFLGVLIFIPLIPNLIFAVQELGGTPSQQIANAHLLFNVCCAIIFLIFINQFKKLVECIVQGKEQEILFKAKYLNDVLPEKNSAAVDLINKEMLYYISICEKQLDEIMDNLSKGKMDIVRISKLEMLTDVLDDKISDSLLLLSKRNISEEEAKHSILLIRVSNLLEQFGDLGEDLAYTFKDAQEKGIEFSADALEGLFETYSIVKQNINILKKPPFSLTKKDSDDMRENDNKLRTSIYKHYKTHIMRLSSKKAPSGSIFIECISKIEAMGGKIRAIRKLLEKN